MKNIFKKLLWISLSLFSSVLWALEVGDLISNTATVNYVVHNMPKKASSNTVDYRLEESDAEISFLYISSGTSSTSVMGATAYRDSEGVWHESESTLASNGLVIGNDTPLNLYDTGFYAIKDTAIIRVVDRDQNINRDIRDHLVVKITVDNGDIEEIQLIETGLDTGIFLGYMTLIDRKGSKYNNNLYVQSGETIVAHYGNESTSVKSDSAVIVLKKNLKLWIEKHVNKTEVGVGELLEYELTVHNDEDFSLRELTIEDALPLGLKYVKATAYFKNKKVNPKYSKDGRTLLFNVENIESHATVKLTFLCTVTAGVYNKKIINEAWVKESRSFKSNVASVTTVVKEELIRSKGTIVGEIYTTNLDLNKTDRAVAGVRLYLENGTYVVSDEKGQYHFNNIKAGEHVIQVDKALLPDGYIMDTCYENSRFGGSNFSQFVHLGKGAMKRVDFCLKQIKKEIKKVDKYTIPTNSKSIPEYGLSDLERKKSREILWPPDGYIPFIPSMEMAIKYPKEESIEILLNGYVVNKIHYNGSVNYKESKRTIALYKGVDLLERGNRIEVKFFDKNKKLTETLRRKIHVASVPVQATYLKEYSYTVADGKKSPVIAIKFLDDSGQPLRAGMTGSFTIESPYQTQEFLDNLQKNPLTHTSSINRYTIHSNGIAYIKLQPTTESGEVILHFDFKGRDEVIRAWLKPSLREWIMVGFAEGTVGYNTLSGNKQSLDEISAKDKMITEGRISFFAKGKIKGDWLLSMAYDTGKEYENSNFFDEIDPNQYYTLYGDNTQQNQEAPSRKKLYVKVEKEQFNILYGDFSTDMSYTELSSYSRRFTGIKSEYHGKYVEGKAFLSETEQLFRRDEIKGDGTSGYYHLESKNIIHFSEKIKIEVRNRYRQEEIVSSAELQRFKDYEIDYALGRLYFKSPIYSNDEQFNPRYIVVSYEIKGDGEKHYTYGGRVAGKALNDKVEIGGSYIYENLGEEVSDLKGIDLRVSLGYATEIKAEYAKSQMSKEGKKIQADAKLAEIEHMKNGFYARAYYREQEKNFGLGQLNKNLSATRKVGAEIAKEFENRQTIRTVFYRDSNLESHQNSDVFETRAEIDSHIWDIYGGYRYSKDNDNLMVQQFLLGASHGFFDQRLKFSVTHDHTITEEKSELFPTKSTVGVDYSINSLVNVFSNYEWLSSEEQGRIGLRVQPWSGMSIENTTLSEKINDSTSLYNTLGGLQSYQVSRNVGINVGFEKAQTIKGEDKYQEDKSFYAYSLGLNYSNEKYSANINAELRDANENDKLNLSTAIYTQTTDTLAMALSGSLNDEKSLAQTLSNKNIRFSLAYRAKDEMMILEKLDFISSKEEDTFNSFKTEKMINNLNINFAPTPKSEISLQHGMKYVVDTVEDFEYKGLTHLFGLDGRYDLTKTWELGFQASMLYAQSANNMDYGLGIYTGHNLFDNMLLTLGYNWMGFEDNDFSLQTYRVEGPYFRFNMKFDQESLKDTVKELSW